MSLHYIPEILYPTNTKSPDGKEKKEASKSFLEKIIDTGAALLGDNSATSNTDYDWGKIKKNYTNNDPASLWNLRKTIEHYDLENLFNDSEKILSSDVDFFSIFTGIKDSVNFANNQEYKKYIVEDSLCKTNDGIKNVRNCLSLCDYMNLGTTVGGVDFLNNWSCVSENDPNEKNDNSGFEGKVFANHKTKELIIGMGATNSFGDWVTDNTQMVKGEVPEQYEDALAFYNKYANDEKYKDYTKTVTGYSLGGSLAQLVVSTEGIKPPNRTITFNAFGTYDIQNNNRRQYNFTNNEDKIYNYITEYDIVCCSGRHVGQTSLINSISDDIVGNHMLSSMHYYLEQKSSPSLIQRTIAEIKATCHQLICSN